VRWCGCQNLRNSANEVMKPETSDSSSQETKNRGSALAKQREKYVQTPGEYVAEIATQFWIAGIQPHINAQVFIKVRSLDVMLTLETYEALEVPRQYSRLVYPVPSRQSVGIS
jgi:hypothetical protein